MNVSEEVAKEVLAEVLDSVKSIMRTPRVLPIYTYNHPVLRETCSPVTEMTDEIRQFCDDLVFTMQEAKGIGLAANQAGRTWRIFAINFGMGIPEQYNAILINPEIIANDDVEVFDFEGCLSLPKIDVEVKRFRNITVRYQDVNMVTHEYETTDKQRGLVARVIQHEIEHLNGGLLIDHLKEIDNDTQVKLNRIAKGQQNTKYRTICK